MEPNEPTWTNLEPKGYQKGAKLPKWSQRHPHNFYVEQVRQKAINKNKKKNYVQKRSVQGCQPAFQDSAKITFFLDLPKMSDIGGLLELKTIKSDRKTRQKSIAEKWRKLS